MADYRRSSSSRLAANFYLPIDAVAETDGRYLLSSTVRIVPSRCQRSDGTVPRLTARDGYGHI